MKYLLCCLTACLIGLFRFPVPAAAVPEEDETVLLVVSRENEAGWLSQLIRACGRPVISMTETEYTPSLGEGYSFLVTTSPIPSPDSATEQMVIRIGARAGSPKGMETVTLPGAQIRLDLGNHSQTMFETGIPVIQSYSGIAIGTLSLPNSPSHGTFPFAVIGDGYAYAPWYQEDGLPGLALGNFLRTCFERTSSLKPGKMYILLDEIYPFSDLEMLQNVADAFSKNGIPFILRIMPVYDNLDYPAFTRYVNTLLYAQTRGGSIVLHDPIIRYQETEREPLEDKMARAVTGLTEKGIELWPMELPPLSITWADVQSMRGGISDTPRQNFGTLPVDTMISLELPKDTAELAELIRLINDNWLSLNSYRNQFTQDEPPYVEIPDEEEPYQYREQGPALMESFFNQANQVLVILVTSCLAIFLLLLYISRKIYLRKFYKK